MILYSGRGASTSVTLGYTFEKTKISGCSKKQKLPQLFFSPYFLYIAARHSNNFFHKLCLSDPLSWPGVGHFCNSWLYHRKPIFLAIFIFYKTLGNSRYTKYNIYNVYKKKKVHRDFEKSLFSGLDHSESVNIPEGEKKNKSGLR